MLERVAPGPSAEAFFLYLREGQVCIPGTLTVCKLLVAPLLPLSQSRIILVLCFLIHKGRV